MLSEVRSPPSSLSDSLVFIRLNKTAVTWLPALDAKSRRWICDVSARTTHMLVVSRYFQSCLWSSSRLTFWKKSCLHCPHPPPVITPQVSLMWPTWRCQERVCEFTKASEEGLTCALNALPHLHSFTTSCVKACFDFSSAGNTCASDICDPCSVYFE